MQGSLYKIINNINNKVYIGKTYDTISNRFQEHKRESQKDRSKDRPLYRAINKYGIENFSIQLIGIYEEGVLEEKEIEFIIKENSYINFDDSRGYNATLGGGGKRNLLVSDVEIIEKYKQLKVMKYVADELNIDEHTVLRVLRGNNIETSNGTLEVIRKKIVLIKDNKELFFDSIASAGEYMVSNGLVKTKIVKQAIKGISRALNGNTSSYYGYIVKEQ